MEAHALLKNHGFQVIGMACCRLVTTAAMSYLVSNRVASYKRETLNLPMAPLQVSSYGTNGHVKLPGTSQREPNVYDFGTPYADIYEDLRQKDENFYSRKGLLQVQTCLGTPSAMLPICLAHPTVLHCEVEKQQ